MTALTLSEAGTATAPAVATTHDPIGPTSDAETLHHRNRWPRMKNPEPEHDPLLQAGAVTCSTCGRTAYPTDAAWVDVGQVLATYAAPCEHTPGRTWVVEPHQLQRQSGFCHAPTRTTGEPCRSRGGQCRHHRGSS